MTDAKAGDRVVRLSGLKRGVILKVEKTFQTNRAFDSCQVKFDDGEEKTLIAAELVAEERIK